MIAVVYNSYGPPEVLRLEEVPKPVPKDGEVLIRIRATSVTAADWRMRKADPFMVRFFAGLTKPKAAVLGMELAGEVESVGSGVTRYKVGDRVCGSTSEAGFGGYAEYKCMPEQGLLAEMPANASFEEAACIFFGGHSALHFLRRGDIQEGQEVLIYGASGALGTYAVQLAKHFKAVVTGVCSTANLDLVRSLGADQVIDYTRENFTRSGKTYGLIFDTVGKSPFSGSVRSLKPKGYYVRSVHMSFGPVLRGIRTNLTTSKKVIGGVAVEHREDLVLLNRLVEEGEIRPVIDRVYPLEQVVEAHRYVETGHKKGNVVLSLEGVGETAS